jgi:OmpA-OmpF porin, OOP family
MSKKTTYLLGMALTIIIGTFLYMKFCCNCYCSNAETNAKPAIVAAPALPSSNFAISGNEFNYQCTDNFRFAKNDFKNLNPIGDSINLGIKNLKMFFDKNPNQQVLITGFATTDEKNTSAYPNLGIARANDIKNYFVSKGFSPAQFDCKGELVEKWKMNADTLLGPANFKVNMIDAATPKIDWTSVKDKINANPLILYFNTNQSEINLTPEERQKVADLVEYLDNVPDSKLSVVGHTDNSGDRKINTKLGLDRAIFAKDYLVKNNVGADRIDTSSKGPDEPIADNKTDDGKAKNRRTVITIK